MMPSEIVFALANGILALTVVICQIRFAVRAHAYLKRADSGYGPAGSALAFAAAIPVLGFLFAPLTIRAIERAAATIGDGRLTADPLLESLGKDVALSSVYTLLAASYAAAPLAMRLGGAAAFALCFAKSVNAFGNRLAMLSAVEQSARA